ncbi:MAG: DUF4337 domain-containing protein [Burkholderiales bacterium]|nr:DUF4337 domain-containing protein [Burkholderiales bacterium]
MEPHESIEDNNDDPFKTRCALLISVLALALAISGLGGSNAGKDAAMNNLLAANAYNFYQAKNVRQTAYKLAADELEAELKREKIEPERKEFLENKLADYRKTVARYESEPETREGKKELMATAKAHEAERDTAMKKDPWFDYAGALLQIGIVLASVAIITLRKSLFAAAGVLGIVGIAFTGNGFLLLV